MHCMLNFKCFAMWHNHSSSCDVCVHDSHKPILLIIGQVSTARSIIMKMLVTVVFV